METSGQKRLGKQAIVDALVLAFSHSPLVNVVGTDALRLVLDIQYPELVDGDEFRIDRLWDLLAEQPGFEAEQAIPPVCRFKTWEARLGLRAHLPDYLSSLSGEEIRGYADNCPVSDDELNETLLASIQRLDGSTPAHGMQILREDGSVLESAQSRPEPIPQKEEKSAKTYVPKAAKEGFRLSAFFSQKAAAVFVTASVVAFAGVMYVNFRDSPIDEISVPIGDIPSALTEIRGSQVTFRLADDSWLDRSKEAIEQDIAAAFQHPKLSRIDAMFLRDSTGKLRLQAIMMPPAPGEPQQLRVLH